MAKRKVIIEGNSEYLIKQQSIYQGRLQVHEFFETMVDVKNVNNAGGEAWTWAQSHWPEFIPEQGPAVVICPQGCEEDESSIFEVETTLRWFCVTGVTDSKGRELPIEEVKKFKKKAKAPRSKEPSKRTKTKPTPRRGVEIPKAEDKLGDNLLAGYTSAEDYKAKAIQKVFEEEDNDGDVQ